MNKDTIINQLAQTHYNWIEAMNWHNATVLESLALIGSEIGETMNECINNQLTEHFGEELADIALRIIDVALVRCNGIDLDHLLLDTEVTWKTANYEGYMNEITIDWAAWVNAGRKPVLEESFTIYLAIVLKRVFIVAEIAKIDLIEEITKKIQKNESRGSRGRVI